MYVIDIKINARNDSTPITGNEFIILTIIPNQGAKNRIDMPTTVPNKANHEYRN